MVCGSVAEYLSEEQQAPVTEKEILMTCGAAGALNVTFKALLDPGDEVLTPIPCFVEYKFYADNHGGVLKTVQTTSDFELDLEAISAAISEKTKAFLINSPNNPTGQVYSEASLKALGEILEKKSREYNRTIYLISDEPYRKIVYESPMNPIAKSSTMTLKSPVFLLPIRKALSALPIPRIFPFPASASGLLR